MAIEKEPFTLAGIPLFGDAAQLGQLVSNNIKYEMVIRQLKALHFIPPRNTFECKCGEFQCATLNVLKSSGL